MVCCSVINNRCTWRDTDAEEVGGGETDTWKQTDKEGRRKDTIEKAKQTEGELRKWKRQGQRETETSGKRETGWWGGRQ